MALVSGSPTRRGLLVAVALLVAGCPARPGPGPQASPSPSPVSGGRITLAYPWEPATLDPFATDDPAAHDLGGLVSPDPDDVFERRPSPDAGAPTSVQISIRSEARWSNQRPVTVDDLRATWRRALRTRAAVRHGYDRIARIVEVGPAIARVEFVAPFVGWRDLFTNLVPSARRDAAAALSAGPFILQRWRPGLDMTFVRNEHAARPALLDRLRVVFVPDAAGALALLERGDVDALGPYLAPDLRRRASDAGATTIAEGEAAMLAVVFNAEVPGLREIEVRRALVAGVDRGRIARALVGSEGEPLDAPDPAAPGDASLPPGNVARGNSILRDAGWVGAPIRRRGGVALEFSLAVAAHDDLSQIVARAVQFQAAGLGVSLRPAAVDAIDLWGSWIQGARFEAAVLVLRSPLRQWFASNRVGPDIARIATPELDEAFDALDRDGTPTSRSALASALVDRAPVIPIAGVRPSVSAGSRVCGVEDAEPTPLAGAAGWHLCA